MTKEFQPEYTLPLEKRLNFGTDAQQIFNEAKAGLDVWIQERVSGLLEDSRKQLRRLEAEAEQEIKDLESSLSELQLGAKGKLEDFRAVLASLPVGEAALSLRDSIGNLEAYLAAREEKYAKIGRNAIKVAKGAVAKAAGLPL